MGIEIRDGHEVCNGVVSFGAKLTPHEMDIAAGLGQHWADHPMDADGAQRVMAATGVVSPTAAVAPASVPESHAPQWPSGDLPPFTVSGIEPRALLAAAWPARFPMASASSRAKAFELVNMYPVGDETAVKRALMDLSGDFDLQDFLRRSESARVASLTDGGTYDALFSSLPGEHKVNASAAKPPPETISIKANESGIRPDAGDGS